jgi:tyrosine-protein kinase Etk/Wzc
MLSKESYKMSESEDFDLAVVFHYLWVHKWFIIILTALSFSIGGLYALRQVPQYESNVLLQIDSNKPVIGQISAVQQFLGGSSGDNAATQIALIKSRFVLEPVINALGLNLSISMKPATLWNRIFPSTTSNQLRFSLFTIPRSLLNKQLTLIVDRPNHVSLYDDSMRFIAAGDMGTLVSTHNKQIQFKIATIKALVGSTFTIIKKSDAKVMHMLLSHLMIEEAGSKMRQNTGILNIILHGTEPEKIVQTLNAIAKITQEKDAEKKSQEAAQTLDFLYKQLPITKKSLEKAEGYLNQYRAKSGKIDIKLQTQFLLNQLSELSKQQAELSINKIEMQQQYMAAHPKLITLNAQIKALKIQEGDLQRELRKLPASDQVAVNLMRDVKVKQSLYLLLLKKIQELQVVKAGTVSNVIILSFAKYPDASLPGNKGMILAASILFGLFLSFVCIFSHRLLFARIEDPHWSERHFSLPNLAIISYSQEQKINFSHSKIDLLAHTHPRSLSVESLRSLRTSLQVTLTCASNNIISIMGVCPGVGKSFISVNLAYLLAAGGKRVLVIDTDLRRGTVHKYFNAPASPGLAEVLSQEFVLEEVIQQSFHENLKFLPRGAYPKDPSELLMNEKFKSLMGVISKKFDVIIVDTAPVLLVTDAVVVGAYSATNYLVLGAGVHQPSEIELAIKRLSSSGIEIHGTIFNFHRLAIATKSQYYGKYYHDSYYYDDTIKS